MKTCPWCAEEIRDDAMVCRFCGRPQQTQSAGAIGPITIQGSPASRNQRSPLPGILALVGAGLLLAGSLIDFGDGFPLVEFSGRAGDALIADLLFWWLPVVVAIVAGILSIGPGQGIRPLAAGLAIAAGVLSVGSTIGVLLYGEEMGAGFLLMLAGAGLLTAGGIVGASGQGPVDVPAHL